MDDKLLIEMNFEEFEAKMKKMKESYKIKCLRETLDFLQMVSFYESFNEERDVKRALEILKKAGEES